MAKNDIPPKNTIHVFNAIREKHIVEFPSILRVCNNEIRIILFRSSRPEVFCKKGVLRNFTKFTGKHLCQSLFFKKVTGLRPVTLLKKRLKLLIPPI